MKLSTSRIAVAAVLMAAAVQPRPARAVIPVTCDNCSDIFTQLMQYAKEAQSVETQLQQYQTQLQQYSNMIQNTVALPMQVWNTVQSDIMRVENLSNAASVLTGNTGTFLSRLQTAGSYVGQVASIGTFGNQLTNWQQTISNNVTTLGTTLGLQQSQAQSNAALLETLQQHSTSAVGQMQAIQAGNELAAANGNVLLQIQASVQSEAQLVAAQIAVDADRRATEDAAMQQFAAPPNVATSGYAQW